MISKSTDILARKINFIIENARRYADKLCKYREMSDCEASPQVKQDLLMHFLRFIASYKAEKLIQGKLNLYTNNWSVIFFLNISLLKLKYLLVKNNVPIRFTKGHICMHRPLR